MSRSLTSLADLGSALASMHTRVSGPQAKIRSPPRNLRVANSASIASLALSRLGNVCSRLQVSIKAKGCWSPLEPLRTYDQVRLPWVPAGATH